LSHRTWEDYRGTHFYKKDLALVVSQQSASREEDASGLTFQEWTLDVDTSQTPVIMLINSRELRAAGFKLTEEVLPPALEAAARGVLRTRGVELRSLEVMDPKRFVLSVDDDTEFRSRCE
jgi:hypothetical protein